MRASTFLSLFLLPLFVNSQSSSAGSSQNVQTITTVITSVGVNSNHDFTTFSQTTTLTITNNGSAASSPTGSASPIVTLTNVNGTLVSTTIQPANTAGGSSSNSSTSSTPTGPLPTAPTGVDGGGNGPNGAPSPGASAPGGQLGPPDSFTAAAASLQAAGPILVAFSGIIAGCWLVWL